MEMKKTLIALVAVALLASVSFADFQEDLQQLMGDNAENYLAPFVTAFGTNMNGGLFHTAKPHKMLGFDVGIRMMGASIPDDAMTYTFQLPSEIAFTDPNSGNSMSISTALLYQNANLEAPTVFGPDSDEDVIITPNEADVRNALGTEMGIPPSLVPASLVSDVMTAGTFPVPPGLDLEIAPLIMPQVSVGLPWKSEVLLRMMPTYNSKEFGDINFFGLGFKHSISQYIPLCPVDISAQYVYQSLTVGDLLESTHTALNVHASKKFSVILFSITPYVGLGIESSNLKVDYLIEGTGNPSIDGTPVSFDLDGDNGFRGRVGFSTRILLFKLYADYSFIGDYGGYTAGFMLSIL